MILTIMFFVNGGLEVAARGADPARAPARAISNNQTRTTNQQQATHNVNIT